LTRNASTEHSLHDKELIGAQRVLHQKYHSLHVVVLLRFAVQEKKEKTFHLEHSTPKYAPKM
jgi:hypothetical protein